MHDVDGKEFTDEQQALGMQVADPQAGTDTLNGISTIQWSGCAFGTCHGADQTARRAGSTPVPPTRVATCHL
jgi:hypothetical protein